jgi:hypothetical protein
MQKADRKQAAGERAGMRHNNLHWVRITSIMVLVVIYFSAISLSSANVQRVKVDPEARIAAAARSGRDQRRLSDGLWQPAFDTAALPSGDERTLPESYSTNQLNQDELAQQLSQAPMEFTDEAANKQVILTLPKPGGGLARFRVEESPVMEPSLALQYPEIKTYSGQGIDDPAATTRFDWTPEGLHAIVLSEEGASFVEPLSPLDTTTYISYFNHDISTDKLSLSCMLSDEEIADAEQRGIALNQGEAAPSFVTGTMLRTYRLAVAATGEFTQQYGGGNVNTALSRITTLVNQVNAIYRKEATIAFQLIGNETSIIFTDAATDGYTNDSPFAMLSENQTKLNAVIGSGNYDIGHVFGGIPVGAGSVAFSGIASALSAQVAKLEACRRWEARSHLSRTAFSSSA